MPDNRYGSRKLTAGTLYHFPETGEGAYSPDGEGLIWYDTLGEAREDADYDKVVQASPVEAYYA